MAAAEYVVSLQQLMSSAQQQIADKELKADAVEFNATDINGANFDKGTGLLAWNPVAANVYVHIGKGYCNM